MDTGNYPQYNTTITVVDGERNSAGVGRVPDSSGSNLESACGQWMIPPGLVLDAGDGDADPHHQEQDQS